MSTPQEIFAAAESVDRAAQTYKDFVLVSDMLKQVGSLEQHITELSAKRDAALADLGGVQEQITLKRDQFEKLDVHHAIKLAAMQADRDALMKQSLSEADAILTKAKSDRDAILSAATLDASNRVNDAKEAAARADEAVSAAQTQVEALLDVTKSLVKDRDAAQSQLDALRDAIAAITGGVRNAHA